ncbi:restriction endonuclease subunit S [Geomonas agri]|uniref:restriction endonuclease subunit S n=1 Tax=Geomonas agri TaxID=2873702 RepID=UPI001CD1FB0E|nr:restriction endonuclease subunit S [Geomonas agri]
MTKQLPVGWKRVTLKSVCNTFIDGDWIESKDQSEDGIRLIQTGNVGLGYFKDKESKKYITEETFNRLNCTEVIPGDILISRLPDPVGRACIVPAMPQRCITAVDCTIVRVDPHKIVSAYLNYVLNTSKTLANVSMYLTGTTRGRISRTNLEKIEIPLPPLETQHKIVSVLDEADNLRKLRKQADDKMKELIPALFDEMFGDPVNNPKGWEIKKLEDITTTIKNGLFKRPHEFGEGTPLVNVVDLFSGYQVDLKRLNRVTASAEELEKYYVGNGDLFFCRSSLKKEGIAKCSVAEGIAEPTVFECHTIMARIDKQAVNPKWLAIQLNHPGVRAYIIARSQTSTMTTVGQKDILAQKFIAPPREIQDSFIEKVNDLEAVVMKQANSITHLDSLFNSLMYRCMNGEIS